MCMKLDLATSDLQVQLILLHYDDSTHDLWSSSSGSSYHSSEYNTAVEKAKTNTKN